MNKLYFGLPLIVVIAFGVFFFVSYVPGEERKDIEAAAAKKVAEEKQRIEKKKHDEEARVAIIADSDRRKKEREARDKELKVARDAMKERFDKAKGELQSLERDNRRLDSEIDEEKRLLERARAEQVAFEKEKTALREYVRVADSNAKRLQDLLEKINAVEMEKAKQAALAAAAAAKGGSN